METIPMYPQRGPSNGTQDLLYRNLAQNDGASGEYCLHPMQNGSKNPFECSEEKEEERNNNVTKKYDETCRIEFVKVLKEDYTGLPKGFEDWSFEQLEQWVMSEGYEVNKMTKSLAYLIPALARPGDCGRSNLEKPEWVDLNLFHQGQKFAMENFFSLAFANLVSQCLTYTDKEALRPLIITSHSDTPYRAFNRFLSTVNRIRSWYTEDPWEEGSAAYKNVAIVRKYHASVRNRLQESSRKEIETDSTITDPWSSICQIFAEDASFACPMNPNWYDFPTRLKYRSIGLNQAEMSIVQFMFIALPITYPEAFGIHNANEADLMAYCHVWRAIGYLLGIEDEYNFCRGSFCEIKQRSNDVLERIMIPNFRTVGAEWEHMTRCMVRGIKFYLPSTPEYETVILYMTDLLKIPMPRLLTSVGYGTQIRLAFLKFFCYYIVKIPGVIRHCNTMVNNCIDKALAFSPKKHSALEEKSTKTLLNFTVG